MKFAHLLLVDVNHPVCETIVCDTIWLWTEKSTVITPHCVLSLKFHDWLLGLHAA